MEMNLSKYFRAKRPIIWINSSDYKKIDELVTESTKGYDNVAIYEYRALGAVDFYTKENSDEIQGLYHFLDIIFSEGINGNVFALLKNIDEELKLPENLAYIKKIAELKSSVSEYNLTIIIISENESVPKELEKFTSLYDIPVMKNFEIEEYIRKFAKKNDIEIDEEDIGEISLSLKGLTRLEIENILNLMTESNKRISKSGIDIIIKEKGQIIKKSGLLELIDFKEKLEDIGGLENLKEWLNNKAEIFRDLDKAKKYGVDTPKGVLLVGMPGCGKSLTAKAAARMFNVPLLRLDIGRLLGKYVGESEHNLKNALKTSEAISPCILWIDEIEKAFAGIDQSGGASDITKRLFGQFLTWLQEKENMVFVVATANDISSFPPEFLRKGRFDEIFYIDFPNKDEREEIFRIHLEKRGKYNRENIYLEKIAKETNGFCGADIEEVIKQTVEECFLKSNENIYTKDIERNIKKVDSMESILGERIKNLRDKYKEYKFKAASLKEGEKKKNDKFKDMILVRGGKYKPSFTATERKVSDLYVNKYLVLQDNWEEITKERPSGFSEKRNPVESIDWIETLKFCNKLSEKYNLKPVYKIENNTLMKIIYKNGQEVSPEKADFKQTEGYRLPTEIEWEWFARGGEIAVQENNFNTAYAGSDNIKEVAWYKENSFEPQPVGLKKANELGLYDCTGNLWEWCYDCYSEGNIIFEDYLYNSSFEKRIIRGGSWNSSNNACKISSRYFVSNLMKNDIIGFRIVRTA